MNEGPPESASEAGLELESLKASTIPEVGGHLHDRLAMLFVAPELAKFQEMLAEEGITLEMLGSLSESEVDRVAALSADFFELEGEDREIRAREIADYIKSVK